MGTLCEFLAVNIHLLSSEQLELVGEWSAWENLDIEVKTFFTGEEITGPVTLGAESTKKLAHLFGSVKGAWIKGRLDAFG